jgi:mRNA-degrading endonuclease RelE of RelBE toxin-antitoxin system
MKTFHKVSRVPGFKADMKRLCKKFRTLEEDLDTFVNVQLVLYHKRRIDNGGVFRIPGLRVEEPKIYKAKKFACRALKGKGSRSGIRVIYAYFKEEDRIELVEIYYKGDKENEDRERIMRCYGSQERLG